MKQSQTWQCELDIEMIMNSVNVLYFEIPPDERYLGWFGITLPPKKRHNIEIPDAQLFGGISHEGHIYFDSLSSRDSFVVYCKLSGINLIKSNYIEL